MYWTALETSSTALVRIRHSRGLPRSRTSYPVDTKTRLAPSEVDRHETQLTIEGGLECGLSWVAFQMGNPACVIDSFQL